MNLSATSRCLDQTDSRGTLIRNSCSLKAAFYSSLLSSFVATSAQNRCASQVYSLSVWGKLDQPGKFSIRHLQSQVFGMGNAERRRGAYKSAERQQLILKDDIEAIWTGSKSITETPDGSMSQMKGNTRSVSRSSATERYCRPVQSTRCSKKNLLLPWLYTLLSSSLFSY